VAAAAAEPLSSPFTAADAAAAQQAWSARLESPVQFKNTIGLGLILIPPGEFDMGFSPAERRQHKYYLSKEAEKWTAPQRVQISKPFYVASHESTVGQFRQFVQEYKLGGAPYAPIAAGNGQGWNEKLRIISTTKSYDWQNTGFTQSDDHPVVNVSWDDAMAFCRWLSQKEGKTYRLLSREEWEYSCRAGTNTRWHHGDDPEKLLVVANVADATLNARWKPAFGSAGFLKSADGFAFTAPVGCFRPNAFGLFDMHGNASELSKENSYSLGGSWKDYPDHCCAALPRARYSFQPRDLETGFRVAMDP
jgi:formylglycine-generating enzyme required for sulfatase activity